MLEAPDESWLLTKVILTLGIFGACRSDDLKNLSISDIKDHGNYFVVFIRDGKTHKSRRFVVNNEGCLFKPCDLIRKYIALRPKNINGTRLLVGYRKGRCFAQNVGIHTISGVPRLVARYLNLENPDCYTGHSLRRSSATMLVEGGGDLLTLKRHGGWRSSGVAEGYVEDSLAAKSKVSLKLFSNVRNIPHTVTSPRVTVVQNKNENEMQEYFGVDDIFDNSQTEQLGSSTITYQPNTNIENIDVRNTVKHAFQHNMRSGQHHGIHISNNQNCTINISYK